MALCVGKTSRLAGVGIECTHRENEVFDFGTERARIAAHRTTDGARNTRELLPSSDSPLATCLDELSEVCPCPRIDSFAVHGIEVSDNMDNKGIESVVRDEHITSTGKHHRSYTIFLCVTERLCDFGF